MTEESDRKLQHLFPLSSLNTYFLTNKTSEEKTVAAASEKPQTPSYCLLEFAQHRYSTICNDFKAVLIKLRTLFYAMRNCTIISSQLLINFIVCVGTVEMKL